MCKLKLGSSPSESRKRKMSVRKVYLKAAVDFKSVHILNPNDTPLAIHLANQMPFERILVLSSRVHPSFGVKLFTHTLLNINDCVRLLNEMKTINIPKLLLICHDLPPEWSELFRTQLKADFFILLGLSNTAVFDLILADSSCIGGSPSLHEELDTDDLPIVFQQLQPWCRVDLGRLRYVRTVPDVILKLPKTLSDYIAEHST